MLGAIIGDIVGSRFEWNNYRAKDFEFLTYKCFPTDDSIMSLALAQAILESKEDFSDLSAKAVECMQRIGRKYPDCGYGGSFRNWIVAEAPQPYGSFGNGAAMRVSAAGFAASSMEEAKKIAREITAVTHNHPEGLKGAEATVVAIYMARSGSSIFEIRDEIDKNYYPMNFTLRQIRSSYTFDETCQGTVPQALMAFFESTGFEDAIRNAVSIGGDSDTLAAITGGVAEAYYGIPADIRKHVLTFLDEELLRILTEFENKYPPMMEKQMEDMHIPVKRKRARKVSGDSREKRMESAVQAADADVNEASQASKQTTSEQLFNHLFGACNILRGPINQDEFKSYVIPILFFKRISDVYDEEYADALEESGNDEEYASAEDMHLFVIPKGCHWEDIRGVSKNVGKAIVKAMTGIEKANPETLSGVFSSFDDATWTDKGKLADERLKDLIEHMSKVKVGNKNYSADIMGDSYEYLIKKFADLSKKNAGEFYTPRPIVKLMVRLLDPKPGESVYDPTCGSAGMLISAVAYLKAQRKEWRNVSLYGQEFNALTCAIGRMNLFLHGIEDFHIAGGNTLEEPAFIENGKLQRFDMIVANPPYSINQWNRKAFESDKYGRNILGVPPQSRADYAFFQHILASMKQKTGRCAILFPHGVLFRNEEKEMREKLVRSDWVDAVIGLGPNLFYNSPMEACIVICRTKKPDAHRGHVLFINAVNEVTRKNAQSNLEPQHIERIATCYEKYKSEDGFAKKVSIREIEKNDFSLNISLYVQATTAETVPETRTIEECYVDWKNSSLEMRKCYERLNDLLKEGEQGSEGSV